MKRLICFIKGHAWHEIAYQYGDAHCERCLHSTSWDLRPQQWRERLALRIWALRWRVENILSDIKWTIKRLRGNNDDVPF